MAACPKLLPVACILASCLQPRVAGSAEGGPAPSAAASQRAGILEGYAVRPPWKVAGVDYPVGMPAGTILRSPEGISMRGVRVDAGSRYVGVSGNDVVLERYDFSGWQVELLAGATNLTVRDSKFLASAAQTLSPIYAAWGGTVTLTGNTIDGGGEQSAANPLFTAGAGGGVVTNNLFIHVPNDAINIFHDGRFIIRNNLFDSLNYGDGHTDCVQTFFSAVSQLDVEYNTVFQPPQDASSKFPGGGNSFIRVGDEKGATIRGLEVAFNTLIYRGRGDTRFANVFDISAGGGNVIRPTVHDNYIDPSGILYGIWSPYQAELTDPLYFGNIDLTSGAPLLASQYNSRTAGMPAGPPVRPRVLNAVKGPSALSLLGTASPRSLVRLSTEGGEILGAAQAGPGGIWVLTAALPAPGAPIVVRATDGLGNASPPADVPLK